MKKLALALILAIILIMTVATPAFAWDPLGDSNKPGNMPDGPGNMPPQGRAALEHADDAMFGLAMGGGWGPATAHAVNRFIRGGWGSFGYWFDDPYAPGIFRVWVCPWD